MRLSAARADRIARRSAQLIEDAIRSFGARVTLDDYDRTEIRCRVDQRVDTVRGVASETVLAGISGRPALFYVAVKDFGKIPEGTRLTMGGELWSIRDVSEEVLTDSVLVKVLICETGGNP